MIDALHNHLLREQTRLNIAYLLLALPLGIVYFVVVILGLSLSTLIVVAVGIPLLILFLFIWWQCATFERYYTMKLLHIEIAPMAVSFAPHLSSWQRLQTHLSRPVTWKSLLYLSLKMPFGVLGISLVLVVPILMLSLSICTFAIGFLIAPFVYLYALIVRIDVDGRVIRRYMMLSLTGCGLALLPLYMINLAATLWGNFAHQMLGMSDISQRLAQATAVAARERVKAERAEKSRSDLIVNVSHELRTPIASIRGHIESLLIACDENQGKELEAETVRSYLNIVHRESIRLGMLFDDLLSVARAEAQELRVNISTVAAGDVVEEVYQTLMPLARRERQITMIREISPGLPLIQADRQRLMQILLNLARNAIAYTPDGGIVSLGVQRHDADYVILSVADTGIGIPSEDQERIFERFYRGDASRTRTTGGFGLGLAIARDFVIAMGGLISVESSVGEGSCFRVCLPVAQSISNKR